MAMRWRGLAATGLHGDVAARLLGEVDARPCGGEGTWLRAWVVLGILWLQKRHLKREFALLQISFR